MKIGIAVSNRIDVISNQIYNELYIPIRCGACFDKKNIKNICGDNTGTNISNKQPLYSELTVEFWLWKNLSLDYYGLCHYRRYLSFSSKRFKTNLQGQIIEIYLDHKTVKKYGLLNDVLMKRLIAEYDLLCNESADVRKIPTPRGLQNTVYKHWEAHDNVFLDARVLPILVETVKNLYPQYYNSTVNYLNGVYHRGYNCYVMRKELFDEMCEFRYGVLINLEQELERKGFLSKIPRSLAYLGEILYGIFIFHVFSLNQYRIKELQLIYFEETEVSDKIFIYYFRRVLFWMKIHFETIGYLLLPKASKRRNFIKKCYFLLVGKNRR